MLAQLLEHAGHIALSLPNDDSIANTVALVRPGQRDIFCISPCLRLPSPARETEPATSGTLSGTKVVVGVWGFTGDPAKSLQRFESPGPDRLVSSMAEAVQFCSEAAASRNPRASLSALHSRTSRALETERLSDQFIGPQPGRVAMNDVDQENLLGPVRHSHRFNLPRTF